MEKKWTVDEVLELFGLPFSDLIHRAQCVHRENFDPNAIQLSTLISIKTGGCSEDCGYCSQSARHPTAVESTPILSKEDVLAAAKLARQNGATRFCMGAAWRGPKERDLDAVLEMVSAVKSLGLETCATLGMLKEGQAERLKDAGLDYYNHNIDTSSSRYEKIVSTRDYGDRLGTLEKVRNAGISVCCGGIIGMGESRANRAEMIAELASQSPQPESVPINQLVQVEGTPLYGEERLDPLEFVRTVAAARITMPKSHVRLSAGRREMSESTQALCFLAGANSIFYGEKLLTTGNPEVEKDRKLLSKLGMHPLTA